MTDLERDRVIRELRRARPRRPFVRFSVGALTLLAMWAILGGSFPVRDFFSARAQTNVARFLAEIRPGPLRPESLGGGESWGAWLADTFGQAAAPAILSTVALSVSAIVLAGLAASVLSLFGARNLAGPEPFAASPRPPGPIARTLHRSLVLAVRGFLILLRAIPEYVWAYLLLTLLGVGAWPAVLALALHNSGILGRLYAETIENLPGEGAATVRALGATRAQLVPLAVLPRSLNRWLLYFFYRWETCVREATVLGLLGFVSLGWYIQDARAGARYDEMVAFVALGAVIILAGDWVSGRVRGRLRTG